MSTYFLWGSTTFTNVFWKYFPGSSWSRGCSWALVCSQSWDEESWPGSFTASARELSHIQQVSCQFIYHQNLHISFHILAEMVVTWLAIISMPGMTWWVIIMRMMMTVTQWLRINLMMQTWMESPAWILKRSKQIIFRWNSSICFTCRSLIGSYCSRQGNKKDVTELETVL